MNGSDPKPASEGEIPILDAQSIVSNDDISLLAKSVREACQNMGFFYVKNHVYGIPRKLSPHSCVEKIRYN